MRRMLALLVVVAACSEPLPEDPPLDGFYRNLAWTCSGPCTITPPVMTATVLEVRGRSLKFTNDDGLVEYHGATDIFDDCMVVPGVREEPVPGEVIFREPYDFCGEHPDAGAAITWTRLQGLDATTYYLRARFR